MASLIAEFKGRYGFLSNFYPSPFFYEGIDWPTVEHAYQAMKVSIIKPTHLMVAYRVFAPRRILLPDQVTPMMFYTLVVTTPSPGLVKQYGRKIPLRPDWEEVKLGVMKQVVLEKFKQNQIIRRWLINTEDAELQEGNWWKDREWGICPPGSGNGRNHLGKILMEVREELRAGTS